MDQEESSARVKYTTIVNKYPSFRDDVIKGCWKWLEGRREDDNAEGLWRVHNKLYNLKDFAKKHPGGKEWIYLTKGMDITEAFEGYHIRSLPTQMLEKFFVKEADESRNYRLTYKEDGFYRVLKSRVAEKLPTLDRSDLWKSKLCLDIIVLALFIASIFAVRFESIWLKIAFIIIAGFFAAFLNSASHNFIHQRNNWRMYTANFVLTGWRDWRVYHGISHHLYPNSITDFEISAYEPFLKWIPVQKRSQLYIWFSYVATPFAYAFMFHGVLLYRLTGVLLAKDKVFFWDELLTFLLPAVMTLLGANPIFSLHNLLSVIAIWSVIMMLGSFVYSVIAVNAGHHGFEIVHEGDEFKSLDYGIYQLGSTIDRIETNDNLAISLASFGNHTLHHLFPSLDHALLPHLRDVLLETCREFEWELKKWTMFDALVEQFKQLGRIHVMSVTEREAYGRKRMNAKINCAINQLSSKDDANSNNNNNNVCK